MFILCIIDLRENEHFFNYFRITVKSFDESSAQEQWKFDIVSNFCKSLVWIGLYKTIQCFTAGRQHSTHVRSQYKRPFWWTRTYRVVNAALPLPKKKRRQSQKIETSACKQKNFIRKYKNWKKEDISQSQWRRKRESKKLWWILHDRKYKKFHKRITKGENNERKKKEEKDSLWEHRSFER